MGNTCNVFFNSGNSDIPNEYESFFKSLAKRSEPAASVDTCDLQSYYNQYEAKSDYRLLKPSDFYKKEFSLTKWAYVTLWDYEELYDHLQNIYDAYDRYPTLGEGDASELRRYWRNLTVSDPYVLYSRIPSGLRSPGLQEAVNDFFGGYEFFSGEEGGILGFGINMVGGAGGGSMGGGTGFLVDNYGFIHAVSKNDFYVVNICLSGLTTFERRDGAGNVLWYLKIDYSELGGARKSFLNNPTEERWRSVSTPIMTNMSEQDWNRFKSSDLFSLFPASEIMDKRIREQIREDQLMEPFFRGVKHWWNSWGWF